MALKQIKNKIIATKKTGQVTKAMESVSAVKMRKSQERAFASRPYVHAAMRVLNRVALSDEGLQHPLTAHRDGGAVLAVIVTSDKGLAGSVNSAVLKEAERLFVAHDDVRVIAVGRKALEYAERAGKQVLSSYTNVSDEVTIEDLYELAQTAMEAFTAEVVNQVVVIYQNFLSTFEQEPTKRQVLPLDPAEVHYIMRGIRPRSGKFADSTDSDTTVVAYTVEPNATEVLAVLMPQLVRIVFYHALLESKASEHSARMVAMKNATDKSKEVVKALTVKYNKERQAAITAEVSEITAGVEAMK